MRDLDEFKGESLPVTYCLEEAMTRPEYRDAMPLERLLARYYYRIGNARLAELVSEVICRHFTPSARFERNILSDSDAKEILSDLIKGGNIDGQYHFVAVYRVLTDFCSYPSEISTFCHKIIGMGLRLNGELLEQKSLYQSVQKGINAHPVFHMPYNRWEQYKLQEGERASTFLRQKKVADLLVDALRDRKILLTE